MDNGFEDRDVIFFSRKLLTKVVKISVIFEKRIHSNLKNINGRINDDDVECFPTQTYGQYTVSTFTK